MNKPVYLGLAILEVCKIVTYKFLVRLHEKGIWIKSKVMLYGCR